MGIADILLLAKSAAELLQYLNTLAAQVHSEGRDPSPEEIQQVKDRTAELNGQWAALLPR